MKHPNEVRNRRSSLRAVDSAQKQIKKRFSSPQTKTFFCSLIPQKNLAASRPEGTSMSESQGDYKPQPGGPCLNHRLEYNHTKATTELPYSKTF